MTAGAASSDQQRSQEHLIISGDDPVERVRIRPQKRDRVRIAGDGKSAHVR